MMNPTISSREAIRENFAPQSVVGFTSGTFDILHAGHVDYLAKAKAQCDVLVVGVNSDSSVKQYKSPLRPIVDERSRAIVVAHLNMVDFVFIFEEKNNQKNISILKPSIYFKAGDYSKNELTSAPLVESYGGKVEIIPFLDGHSSTSIIEKIHAQALAHYAPLPFEEPRPALFVDRDGTVIKLVEYLSSPADVELIPGAGAALKEAREKGYWIIFISNQQGIGLGYFSLHDFYKVNLACLKALSKEGALIDKSYFCPSSMGQSDENRKPGIGMIERACRELPIVREKSIVIGDTTTDIQTGKNARMKTVLVETGKGGKDNIYSVEPDYRIASIAYLGNIISDT
jgi:rfaE bifunctional protein nucleotidyltransferase chain/domain